ncbi:hypothetical protein Tco_1555349, partial [Tanacetum coccineum]
CKGGDMGGGGVIATVVSRGDGGDGEVMERVRESGYGDRIWSWSERNNGRIGERECL